jgi:hypothetical protein
LSFRGPEDGELQTRLRRALEHWPHRTAWLSFFLKVKPGTLPLLGDILDELELFPADDPLCTRPYAKVAVEVNQGAIVAAIRRVKRACAQAGIEIVAIDLDPSPAAQQPNVVSLFWT